VIAQRLLAAQVLIAAVTVAAGCTTRIITPENPSAPTAVFIVDYGRHTSLVLPAQDGKSLVEYSYGDWNWYALDKSGLLDVFPTMLWPTRGTLGRRSLHVEPNSFQIRRETKCDQVLKVIVAGEQAAALLVQLRSEYDEHIDSIPFQERFHLKFVHSDRSFHLFHNCNQQVAARLRDLGCKVQGPAMFAQFIVQRPHVAPTRKSPH
jgi:hypothetical protein